MARPPPWVPLTVLGLVLLLGIATGVFWDDLQRNALDPKIPFQTYKPPRAPDYARSSSWYLLPTDPVHAPAGAVDVFFLSPTTYDGGEQWNAPIDDRRGGKLFQRVMAPNYAGPFVRVGRLYAPRYRQASLYSELTLREDAREARRFAYGDVLAAFRFYLRQDNQGRPFVLVGVEQGGFLADRLLREEVAPNPAVRGRLVAAYLVRTVIPAQDPPLPPCMRRAEAGCLAAWMSLRADEFERAQGLLDRTLVWGPQGELVGLNGRTPLCFNPLLGATTDAPAPARFNLGAVDATGLEWDARPAFLPRQVSAQCQGGLLRVSAPKSGEFRRRGSWADRKKVPGYNLFYADTEADARARVAALTARAQGAQP